MVADGHVPRRPVLPAQRLHDPAAAAARARRRPAAAGRALRQAVQPGAGQGGAGGSPRRRWSCCGATPGRATCASCRASSSRPCSRPPGRSSCRSSCPPRSAAGRRARARPTAAFDFGGLTGFVQDQLAGGLDGPVRRVPGPDRAAPAHRGAPPHRGEPVPGGEGPGHHPRHPAGQADRAGHPGRAAGPGRRRGARMSRIHSRNIDVFNLSQLIACMPPSGDWLDSLHRALRGSGRHAGRCGGGPRTEAFPHFGVIDLRRRSETDKRPDSESASLLSQEWI